MAKGINGKIRIHPLNIGGGISKKGKTIIDPDHAKPVTLPDGRKVDPKKYTDIHEQDEKKAIERYEKANPIKKGESLEAFDKRMYKVVHLHASNTEDRALKKDDIDPKTYDKAIEPGLDKAAMKPRSVNPADLIQEHKTVAKVIEKKYRGIGKKRRKES